MRITDKINFRQPKYMLPAILYLPLLFFGYFFFRFFNIEKAEVDDKKQTTTYYNDKLPDANLKGDGIGDKYSNMVNNFGKIKDESAVENIDRDSEEQKDEYKSQYTDAEVAAMDRQSEEAQRSMERLRQLQEQIKEQQNKENNISGNHYGNTYDEQRTLDDLQKKLADARDESLRSNGVVSTNETEQGKSSNNVGSKSKASNSEGEKTINENAVNEIAEEAEPEEVVKRQKETSEYFNTIATNEPQHKLIRAIVDEEITAVDGSRVRFRLLDDIEIGDRIVSKGTCMYGTLSGFGQQRVKGTIKSVLYKDELIKIQLSIYDTDGLEGLYVPKSSFGETVKDVASSTVSQNMTFSDGTVSGTTARWGQQAIQNAYRKASNALSKNIRKNRVRVKYGTMVYLINSKDKQKR